LVGLLLEVLLVHAQLLADFGTGSAGKKTLEFDVNFLLLLNLNVFLDNFFSLLDQPLLQSLDLL